MKNKNFIDLFCGAGGLSLGFEYEGFECLLAIDKWKDAIETYNFNRTTKCGQNIDIHDFSDDKIELLKREQGVCGLIGGPPCQGFSLVGKRDIKDERNTLYLEYVRFVRVAKPCFFILENVKGLLSLDGGMYKEDILKVFTELGYNVSFKVLRASEYGVPQTRERIFFIGLRKEVFNDVFFDFDLIQRRPMVSTYEALSDLPSLDNNEDQNFYKTEAQNDFQTMMREGCSKIENNEMTIHTKQTKMIISMVKDGGNIKDLPEEFYKIRNYNASFRRMNSMLPSGTIDCGHRNYFHYCENRIPTVRESARLQSFPDKYIFIGNKSSQYTQVGNAVPVVLARAIAKVIMKYLGSIKEERDSE